MTATPFLTAAPALWARNLPAIPLLPEDKRPFLPAWQRFSETMPAPELQASWLTLYPGHNVGLPMGPQSRAVAIDLDTDDPRARRVIEALLPSSPWVRRGKKGAVFLYRFNGERSFKIRALGGGTLCECLSRGNQIVLPPSIHPETLEPYSASSQLADIIDGLPFLPPELETLLRGAFIAAGIELSSRGHTRITEWVPAGARDNAMVAHAGLLARAITRGERTLAEALDEITEWISSFTQHVAGDGLDPQKGRDKVIEFLLRDITGPAKKTLPKGWDAGLAADVAALVVKQIGDEAIDWDIEDFHKSIDTVLCRADRGSSEWSLEVDEVCAKIARAGRLTSIQEDMLVRKLSDLSGRSITASALRRRISEMRSGPIKGRDHTELAKAVIRELSSFGAVRHWQGRFWQWRGACWAPMDDVEILRVASEEFGSYDAARKAGDLRGILQLAAAFAYGPLQTAAIDGINFANGFLAEDLVLKPHAAEYGKTYALPYRYEPAKAGGCGRFLDFLNDCWGHDQDYQQKVQAIREAIAVTLFGLGAYFARAFCLYGVSRSGKTTLRNIIVGLMPETSVCSVPPHEWGDRFAPAQMVGKAINLCGELSEHKLIDGDMFKSIVEGEEINGQHKNQQIFRFRPTCAHWFASNHLPRTRDSSAGFLRRWLVFEFNRPVPLTEKRLDLAVEILAEEREAIAAWAVEALPGLKSRQEYTFPSSHDAIMEEVANSNNSVRFFLTAAGQVRVVPSQERQPSDTISEMTLHDLYWCFCNTVALVKPVSLKTFRLRMRELVPEFGFRLRLETSGNTDAGWYDGITAAADRVGRRSA